MNTNAGLSGIIRLSLVCVTIIIPLVVGQEKVPQKAPPKEDVKAVAQVPFDFFAGDTNMQAGQYEMRVVGPTHFLIRNCDDPRTVAEIFTSRDPEDAVKNADAKLIFIEREKKHYLVGILTADGRHRVTALYGESLREGDVRKQIALVYK